MTKLFCEYILMHVHESVNATGLQPLDNVMNGSEIFRIIHASLGFSSRVLNTSENWKLSTTMQMSSCEYVETMSGLAFASSKTRSRG